MQEHDFKTIADSLKSYTELSKSKEKEVEQHLTNMLASADLIRAFTKELLTPIKLSRSVLRTLVNTIEKIIRDSDRDGQIELNDKLFDLLEVIVKLDKIDSNARWMALSVYLNYADITQANRVFRETLSNVEKLKNNYEKHIYKNLIPDGGLPFLLRLMLSRQPLEIAWLKDLLKIVVSKIMPGSISQLTRDEIRIYIYKLVQGHRSLTIEAKPIINLAIKVNEEIQEFEKELDAVLKVLETASSKYGGITNDWQENIIAIKHRHAGMKPTNHLLPLLEKGHGVEEKNKVNLELEKKETKDMPVSFSVQGIENGDLIRKQRQVIKSLSVNIRELERSCSIIESLEQENIRLKEDVNRLKKQNVNLDEQITNLNERHYEMLRSLQAKEQLIERREQDIIEAELRHIEELAIVKHDVSLELATFRSKLWGQLRGSLDEALDDSIVSEQLPVNERIYLNRLRKILEVLRTNDIADDKPEVR